jgi:predicted site-specific integrase-resolvase
MNGHRPKLKEAFGANDSIQILWVEHRDRLMLFGNKYLELVLTSQWRKLIVADPSELKDDLVQDMIEVLTSFCARLYGRRSAKNKAKKALKVIQNED